MRTVPKLLLSAWLAIAPAWLVAGPLDINTADADALAKVMQGIGPQKARAIVSHREQHGPFKSVDELSQVKGIGRKAVDDNREKITIGSPGASTTAR
jgi:competence protein ComEA